MTAKQETQFLRFACVPRCLMELAARVGKPITKEEFCERFSQYFHSPDDQYGLLKVELIPKIAASLSIPSSVHKAKPPTDLAEADYELTRRLFKIGSHILIESQINLNQGAADPLGHCSVLNKIDEQSFELWTPSQDGKDYVLPPFTKADWSNKQCRGMALR